MVVSFYLLFQDSWKFLYIPRPVGEFSLTSRVTILRGVFFIVFATVCTYVLRVRSNPPSWQIPPQLTKSTFHGLSRTHKKQSHLVSHRISTTAPLHFSSTFDHGVQTNRKKNTANKKNKHYFPPSSKSNTQAVNSRNHSLPIPISYFGSRTMPSKSRDAIYSSVRSKCFLGRSVDPPTSAVARFEWISSIRPLRYLTVTFYRLLVGSGEEGS